MLEEQLIALNTNLERLLAVLEPMRKTGEALILQGPVTQAEKAATKAVKAAKSAAKVTAPPAPEPVPDGLPEDPTESVTLAPTATVEVTPEPAPAPEKPLTLEDLRQRFSALNKSGKRSELLGVLAQFHLKTLQEATQDLFPAIAEQLDSLEAA